MAAALRFHGGPRVEVLDPAGEWLRTWDRQLAAQDVPHLRSPATHHPHPYPYALLADVAEEELVRREETLLPTAAGFRRFTTAMIEEFELGDLVTAAQVTAVQARADGRLQLMTTDGPRCPQRVVLATNVRVPQIPPGLLEVAGHADVHLGSAIDLESTPPGGEVMVIGAGLSAAHLAAGAVARGAHVTLVTRREPRVRPYDTDIVWMGQWKLREFEDEPDPAVRRETIDTARDGGSMPRWFHEQLLDHQRRGDLELLTNRTVTGVTTAGHRLCVTLSDGSVVESDTIWSATGARADIGSDPLVRELIDQYPTPIIGGLPVLDAALRWPGTAVHLVGPAAGLVLGPGAGNLIGHRRAAQRIATFLNAGEPTRAERDPAWTDVVRPAEAASHV